MQPATTRDPLQATASGLGPPAIETPTPAGRSSHRHWRRTADLVITSSVSFIVLTIAAMVVFPGGARYAAGARHYRFTENFLSDLGATHTISGRANVLSRWLFTFAVTWVGISLASFGPASKIWAAPGRAKLSGAVATVCAALSGLSFVAVAFTPSDRKPDMHDTYTRSAFGLLAAFVLILATMQLRHRAPLRWIGANVACAVGLGAYGVMQFTGPDLFTRRGIHIQAAAQKIVVYASILNLGLQAWAVRRHARSHSRQ